MWTWVAARLAQSVRGVCGFKPHHVADSCQRHLPVLLTAGTDTVNSAPSRPSQPRFAARPCHSARPSRLCTPESTKSLRSRCRASVDVASAPINAGSVACCGRSQHVCRAVGDQPAIFRVSARPKGCCALRSAIRAQSCIPHRRLL